VLALHLKRFENVGLYRKSLRKLNDDISFQHVLDMTSFIQDVEQEYTYTLFGLVEHSGTMTGGHYVAHVLSGDEWVSCSDTHTRTSNADDVLNRQAYILFYQRIIIKVPPI
jgi:ubiquitin carboxyl-terminal hydrolase 16/45